MLDNAYDNDSEVRRSEKVNSETTDKDTHAPPPAAFAAVDAPRFVAPTHSGVDILKLLSELEDLVENTRRGPAGILFRFDDEKFHYLVMKIRANLPEEMKRASKLARDSERIVEESRGSAERILIEAHEAALSELESAKAEAERLLEGADLEARGRLEEAQREARHLQEAARQAAEEVLAAARAQAAQLVADSQIVQQAQVMAQDLQARTHQEAMAVRQGADDYARDVLANLEAVLGKAMTQIQRGRDMLERPH